MVYGFNAGTWEAEVGRSPSYMSAWSTHKTNSHTRE